MKARIVRNPKILVGKPIVAGTRIPMTLILNLLAHGQTIKEISEVLPDSTKILSKVEFSCAGNEQITNMIEKMDRKNVVICGMETHVCIYQRSRDLAKKGYNVYVSY